LDASKFDPEDATGGILVLPEHVTTDSDMIIEFIGDTTFGAHCAVVFSRTRIVAAARASESELMYSLYRDRSFIVRWGEMIVFPFEVEVLLSCELMGLFNVDGWLWSRAVNRFVPLIVAINYDSIRRVHEFYVRVAGMCKPFRKCNVVPQRGVIVRPGQYIFWDYLMRAK
jgi:hypothetical protein